MIQNLTTNKKGKASEKQLKYFLDYATNRSL